MNDAPILVVDDTDDVRDVVITILERLGLSSSGVENVSAAKAWLGKNAPRLVILDVMMPDGNGLDLCRWIRAQPGLADVPIIVMTAIQDEETAHDAIAEGATDYIRKPIDIEDLAAKIGRFIPVKPRDR
jgi:DNA-binding response OmpR family regulator